MKPTKRIRWCCAPDGECNMSNELQQRGRHQPEILIITVQYKNPADSAALLASVSRCDGVERCEMIIVDNGSDTDAATELDALIASAPFAVRVLHPAGN